jgi:hypothetical protein
MDEKRSPVVFRLEQTIFASQWSVVAVLPDGRERCISGFMTEAAAKDWIMRGSRAWLKKRGYGDE